MPAVGQPAFPAMVAQRPVPSSVLPPVSLSIKRATCLLPIKVTTGFVRYSKAQGSSQRLPGMALLVSRVMVGQELPVPLILHSVLPSTVVVVSTSQISAITVFVNWRLPPTISRRPRLAPAAWYRIFFFRRRRRRRSPASPFRSRKAVSRNTASVQLRAARLVQVIPRERSAQ